MSSASGRATSRGSRRNRRDGRHATQSRRQPTSFPKMFQQEDRAVAVAFRMVQRTVRLLREPIAGACDHPRTDGTELRETHQDTIPLHGADALAGLLALADSMHGRRHRLEPAFVQFVAALVAPRSGHGVGSAGSCPRHRPERLFGVEEADNLNSSRSVSRQAGDSLLGGGTPVPRCTMGVAAATAARCASWPGRRVADHAHGSRRECGAFEAQRPVAGRAPRMAGRATALGLTACDRAERGEAGFGAAAG